MRKKKLQEELAALKAQHGELLEKINDENADVLAIQSQSDELEDQINAKKEALAAIEKLEEKTRQNAEQAQNKQAHSRVEVHDRILDKPWESFGEQLQAVYN